MRNFPRWRRKIKYETWREYISEQILIGYRNDLICWLIGHGKKQEKMYCTICSRCYLVLVQR